MYCPKCGGQNSDDLAYCRECGENLKIISQVMKGHTPVALASKIDSIIENKDERLRRDAVFFGIFGVIAAIWAYFAVAFGLSSSWIENVLTVGFPPFFLLVAGLNYLAFRRSQ